MKSLVISTFGIALLAIALSCNSTNGKSKESTEAATSASAKERKSLSAVDFEALLKQTPNAQIVDVRTGEEVSGGVISGAVHVDLYRKDFETALGLLDPKRPTFVYCLGGGRSAEAAALMEKKGFEKIYELMGGINAWKRAGKNLVSLEDPTQKAKNENEHPSGMTQADYRLKVKEAPLVLVDFNAVWCRPCQALKPIVEQIAQERSSYLKLLSIDTDKNPEVATKEGVDAIPDLRLFKNGVQVWSGVGLMSKEQLDAEIAKHAPKGKK